MTQQAPDKLIYDGWTYDTRSEPLEDYFKQTGSRPDFHSLNRGSWCSACWRGYKATWEVVDDRLHLADLKGMFEGRSDVTLKAVFPDADGRVLADWFTGTIRIPRGKAISFIPSGSTKYERDILMYFRKGTLEDTEMLKNEVR